MTGNQLRIEIKKLGITQGDAAAMLGIDRRTLQNWFSKDILDANMSQSVKDKLGVEDDERSLNETITIKQLLENNKILSETNQKLTTTNQELTERILKLLDELDYERKKSDIVNVEHVRSANAG